MVIKSNRKPTDAVPYQGIKEPSTWSGHNLDEIRKSIYKCNGIMTCIMSDLGIPKSNAQAIQHIIRTHPDLKQDIIKAREQMVGHAEERMLALVDSSDQRIAYEASKYILDKIGKYNGWGHRSTGMIELDTEDQINDSKMTKIRAIFNLGEPDDDDFEQPKNITININTNNKPDDDDDDGLISEPDVIEIDNNAD